jgi:hypothetical protein
MRSWGKEERCVAVVTIQHCCHINPLPVVLGDETRVSKVTAQSNNEDKSSANKPVCNLLQHRKTISIMKMII